MTAQRSWTDEQLVRFWCRMSLHDGLSARESLRRYRAAGHRISDVRFHTVWHDVKRGMLR